MDKRTTGIVATVATVILCGCPGLLSLCWGATAAIASQVPGAEIDIGGSSAPMAGTVSGLVAFCLGALFIAIPVVVGYLTLRRKPAPGVGVDESLPPAI